LPSSSSREAPPPGAHACVTHVTQAAGSMSVSRTFHHTQTARRLQHTTQHAARSTQLATRHSNTQHHTHRWRCGTSCRPRPPSPRPPRCHRHQ
jgi:hypothetical protein